MPPGIRNALRWLSYLTAAAIILLALAVGVLRLLLPLAPEYQQQIRQQVVAATGYQLEFQRISASWPLAGPALSFYDVSLTAPGGAAPLLRARELSAGVSLWRMLRDRQVAIARVHVEGSSTEVLRDADGRFLFQGRLIDELLPKRQQGVKPLQVVLEDISIDFTDRQRDRPPFLVHVDRVTIGVEPGSVELEAEVDLDARYGRQASVALQFPLAPDNPGAIPSAWSGKLAGRDLDVAALLRYALDESLPLAAARGDLSIEADFSAADRRRLGIQTTLRDVRVGAGEIEVAYDSVSGQFGWNRVPEGWDVVARGLRMRRGERAWPLSTMELHYRSSTEAMPAQWVAAASFARLEDLLPLARALSAGTELSQSLPQALSGDLREVTGEFAAEAEAPVRFTLRGAFERLSVTSASGEISAANLSGSVAADGNGGRLQLAADSPSLMLQAWFRDRLAADRLDGTVSWRSGPQGISVQSEDLRVAAPGIRIESRLQLDFPADRSSPLIALNASAAAEQAREILRYLPLKKFPPPVVGWLERAVVGGRVPQAVAEFRGPLRGFPYESAEEGVFRVEMGLENATLDYADGWPRVEELNGMVVFDGVSMYSMRNSARIGNLRVADFQVRIPDLREGVLALAGRHSVGLDQVFEFLRLTPVAAALGSSLHRVTAAGPVDASLQLALPLKKAADYKLQVLFDVNGGKLGWQGLDFGFDKVRGRARLQNTRLDARRLTASFLNGPVEIAVAPVAERNSPVSHIATVRGTTPVPRVMSTFRLPLPERFAGQIDWTAVAKIPAGRGGEPLRMGVRSEMVGVTSLMPAPLAKPADLAWPMDVELAFTRDGVIDVGGGLSDPDYAWALRLTSANSGWRVDRGAVVAGGRSAQLPDRRGVEFSGRLPELHFGDWLALGEGGDGRDFRELYREARLRIDRFGVVGQLFRDLDLNARRGKDGWTVDVAAPNLAGRIVAPFDMRGSTPLALDMQRLWLMESDTGGGPQRPDPREAPALEIKAADAALGEWRFGAVELSAVKTADGLVARRIATRAPSFKIDGDGAWRVQDGDAARQVSEIKIVLASTNVKDTLTQLGYDPVIDAKSARVGVDIRWPDAPSADFLKDASGEISVAIDNGQVLNLEPGSGRLLGLLSVTALPRRLALDFRDVFKKGLAFDAIRGDFRLGGGSAYTCNLGLEGPSASIAMIGETGLVKRDYEQLAVVRPEVSNMLTVGGAVLGGPVGGATMLLVSQLFRKPLSTLGESYYRMTGTWDEPLVTRIERGEADTSAFKDCERELAATLQATEEITGAGTANGTRPAASP
jgi:uncharacterized protein (TIGR02099 family)